MIFCEYCDKKARFKVNYEMSYRGAVSLEESYVCEDCYKHVDALFLITYEEVVHEYGIYWKADGKTWTLSFTTNNEEEAKAHIDSQCAVILLDSNKTYELDSPLKVPYTRIYSL